MPFILRFSAVIAVLSLAACGGGSDNKPAKSSSSTSVNSVVSSTAAISSVAPGSAAQSSMAASSAPATMVQVKINGAIHAFEADNTASRLDETQVQVTAYLLDENEQTLANATPAVSGYSTDELRFNADLSGAGATSVVVNVTAPGYTSYARKLKVEEKIDLDAKLQAIPVQTVVASTATAASGAELTGFNIQVSADDDAQSNSLLINIPQSLLPDDTSSLDVAVRTFDPNDPDDAEFFPGAYADSNGNQLASVGFNFADIKTNNNETVVNAMRKARMQKMAKTGGNQKTVAEEPVTINYQIPAQSCSLLETLGDSAPAQIGFQVPVYTYNSASGLWDLIGQGTLYNEAAQQVPATQTVFDCSTETFTLEILVTNEIFQREWWNLDYPLMFNQPTDYCATVQLKNPEGETLAGINGLVMDDDGDFDFASNFFTSDSNGKATIRVSQSSLNPDLEAEVIFFDENTFNYVTHKVTLSTNCANSAVQPLVLTRPKLCEVSGNFTYDSGKPANRNTVYGFTTEGSSIIGFDFANSNAQGNYRLNLPCGGEYYIVNFGSLLAGQDNYTKQVTRIDGNLDADEQSDNGAAVVMKNVTISHIQPLTMGEYNVESKTLTLVAYSTFDAFPMSAQVTIKTLDGKTTLQSFSGDFAVDSRGDENEIQYYFVGNLIHSIDLPATEHGYVTEITFVDALGKTWTAVPGIISVK